MSSSYRSAFRQALLELERSLTQKDALERRISDLKTAIPPSAPGMGYMFKITRTAGDKYPARTISSVGIFPCTSARDEEADVALRKLLSTKPITAVTCVRVDEHPVSETCAVHTAESCLSCEPLG